MPAPTQPFWAVECDALSHTFVRWHGFRLERRQRQALSGLELRIEPGARVALLGPNGAGKSTLLRILATLVVPTTGQTHLFGHDLRKDPHAARSLVGLATSEDRSFHWRLSGRENLRFFATLQGLNGKARAVAVDRMLDRVGLLPDADVRVGEYSTGMRQRLGFGRALLHGPRLLLLDEPDRSLDPGGRQRLGQLLIELGEADPSLTVLFATHDLAQARQLATLALLLREGHLLRCDEPTIVVAEAELLFAGEVKP